MTYSQPQQPAQGGKPNRLALWVNTRKQQPSHPDYKGHVEISWELLQELNAAFNAGRYAHDFGGRPCIKLDMAVYAQQPDARKPVMSGQLSTVAETEHSAAMREQARAQNGYQQQPAAPQYAPQPPQGYQQPPQQPMPQQAPAPAYQQPPMPQAPVPVAAPMPNAIHGQPPAAPAPAQQLPPGF